jgi:hypothetical protein
VRGYNDETYNNCKQQFNSTRNELLFTNDCKEFYENISREQIPINLCRPFTPFRLTQTITENNTPLLFKIPHAPGPTNKEIRTALQFDKFLQKFKTNIHAAALTPFETQTIICKTRTYKIQDSLIRSKLTHNLPTNF